MHGAQFLMDTMRIFPDTRIKKLFTAQKARVSPHPTPKGLSQLWWGPTHTIQLSTPHRFAFLYFLDSSSKSWAPLHLRLPPPTPVPPHTHTHSSKTENWDVF